MRHQLDWNQSFGRVNSRQAKTIQIKIKIGLGLALGHGRKKQKQLETFMVAIGNQLLCLRLGIDR
jgi:hypothetical protein